MMRLITKIQYFEEVYGDKHYILGFDEIREFYKYKVMLDPSLDLDMFIMKYYVVDELYRIHGAIYINISGDYIRAYIVDNEIVMNLVKKKIIELINSVIKQQKIMKDNIITVYSNNQQLINKLADYYKRRKIEYRKTYRYIDAKIGKYIIEKHVINKLRKMDKNTHPLAKYLEVTA